MIVATGLSASGLREIVSVCSTTLPALSTARIVSFSDLAEEPTVSRLIDQYGLPGTKSNFPLLFPNVHDKSVIPMSSFA